MGSCIFPYYFFLLLLLLLFPPCFTDDGGWCFQVEPRVGWPGQAVGCTVKIIHKNIYHAATRTMGHHDTVFYVTRVNELGYDTFIFIYFFMMLPIFELIKLNECLCQRQQPRVCLRSGRKTWHYCVDKTIEIVGGRWRCLGSRVVGNKHFDGWLFYGILFLFCDTLLGTNTCIFKSSTVHFFARLFMKAFCCCSEDFLFLSILIFFL